MYIFVKYKKMYSYTVVESVYKSFILYIINKICIGMYILQLCQDLSG